MDKLTAQLVDLAMSMGVGEQDPRGHLIHNAADLLRDCEPYLKEGETPAQCIKRNRDDWTRMVTTLKEATARAEAAEAELTRLRTERAELVEALRGLPLRGGACKWIAADDLTALIERMEKSHD